MNVAINNIEKKKMKKEVGEFGSSFFNLFRKKQIKVGVILGFKEINFVLASQKSQSSWKILKYKRVPLPEGIDRNSPEFPSILGLAMKNFLKKHKNAQVWSTIQSNEIDTQLFDIPKVSPGKIANAALWAFKRKSSFNPSTSIFDFKITREKTGNSGKKLEVFGYTAPKSEILKLKDLFIEAGFPLTGVSVTTFAIRNVLENNCLQSQGKNQCIFFVGRDWSRIDIFTNGTLAISRDIKIGLNSLVEAIREDIETRQKPEPQESQEASIPTIEPVLSLEMEDASPSIDLDLSGSLDLMEKEEPEELEDSDGEADALEDEEQAEAKDSADLASEILWQAISGIDPEERDDSLPYYSNEEILEVIAPALDRLGWQIERTIEHFFQTHQGEDINSDIYVSGPICGFRELTEHLKTKIHGSITNVTSIPVVEQNFHDPFEDVSPAEKDSFIPAVGMALSDIVKTPNFIYTHKEQRLEKKVGLFSRGVFFLFLTLLATAALFTQLQESEILEKKSQIGSLTRQLKIYEKPVSQSMIQELLAQQERKKQKIRDYATNNRDLAFLREIASITPRHVRLSKLALLPEEEKTLTFEGIVSGKHTSLDSRFIRYIFRLSNSRLFQNPVILQKTEKKYNQKKVLYFQIRMDLI